MLDPSGKATISCPINMIGPYLLELSVTKGAQTRAATAPVIVTAQQGGRCP